MPQISPPCTKSPRAFQPETTDLSTSRAAKHLLVGLASFAHVQWIPAAWAVPMKFTGMLTCINLKMHIYIESIYICTYTDIYPSIHACIYIYIYIYVQKYEHMTVGFLEQFMLCCNEEAWTLHTEFCPQTAMSLREA